MAGFCKMDGLVQFSRHGPRNAAQGIELKTERRRTSDRTGKQCVLKAVLWFAEIALCDSQTGPGDRVGVVQFAQPPTFHLPPSFDGTEGANEDREWCAQCYRSRVCRAQH